MYFCYIKARPSAQGWASFVLKFKYKWVHSNWSSPLGFSHFEDFPYKDLGFHKKCCTLSFYLIIGWIFMQSLGIKLYISSTL